MHEQSALTSVLKALIPYSRENLLLTYKPNQFFDELERSTTYGRQTLKNAMWQAKSRGLVEREGKLVKLTSKGLKAMRPYTAQKLNHGANLMVVFDIPETESYLRQRLRTLLREWRFEQVQKSVWVSKYDYKKYLVQALKEMDAQDYVQVFECARLFPK